MRKTGTYHEGRNVAKTYSIPRLPKTLTAHPVRTTVDLQSFAVVRPGLQRAGSRTCDARTYHR